MNARNTPCTECRKRRRKCVRSESASHCQRCERLNKLCVQASKQRSVDSDSNDECDEQVESLRMQIRELEIAIKQVEHELLLTRSQASTTALSKSRNASVPTSTTIQHLKNSSPSALSLSSWSTSAIQNMINSKDWVVRIENGTFRIETGIKTLSDLLPFVRSIPPYVSPFSSGLRTDDSGYCSENSSPDNDNNNRLLLTFGTGPYNKPFTVRLLMRLLGTKRLKESESLLLPRELVLNHRPVIDELLTIFLNCQNSYKPLVHEPSFRAHYTKVRDPLADLLTLSICSFVCSTPCEHVTYSPRERRNMADFFHSKAKAILLDQFDDPSKRLENVMAVNLMAKYMHITLKFTECRQLVSLAYDLCMDLNREWFAASKDPRDPHFWSNSSTYTTADDSLQKPAYESPSDDVQQVMFTRHTVFIIGMRRIMAYIANETLEENCWHYTTVKYLEDEPESAKKGSMMLNWLFSLFNHPFVVHFLKQVHRVHLGKTCTLSLESIIRIEEVIKEWGASLPVDFRVCDDITNSEACKKAINESTDLCTLITFMHFQLFQVMIFSSLLQPIALSADNEQLLSYVQQHSLDKSLNSCRMLLYTIQHIGRKKIASKCAYVILVTDSLFDAVDVLIQLAMSPNKHIAKEARGMMNACLNEIDSLQFMQGHQVPTDQSPLLAGMETLAKGERFNIEFYDQYPQPWFAMLYDASHVFATVQQ